MPQEVQDWPFAGSKGPRLSRKANGLPATTRSKPPEQAKETVTVRVKGMEKVCGVGPISHGDLRPKCTISSPGTGSRKVSILLLASGPSKLRMVFPLPRDLGRADRLD